jgi:DNA polymerase I
VAYVDYCQQEIGIAAGFSRDPVMQEAYRTGDPYLDLSKTAGALPPGSTNKTLTEAQMEVRELYKSCSLGVLFGMEAPGLAKRIEKPLTVAQALIEDHKSVFRIFWKWSDRVVSSAAQHGILYTVFKWPLHVCETIDKTSKCRRLKTTVLRNFPMQANAAEVLRLAICLATEAGVEVCCPVHDAVLICAPLDRLDTDIAKTQECMREASRIVLSGFELRTEVKPENKDQDGNVVNTGVRYPGR